MCLQDCQKQHGEVADGMDKWGRHADRRLAKNAPSGDTFSTTEIIPVDSIAVPMVSAEDNKAVAMAVLVVHNTVDCQNSIRLPMMIVQDNMAVVLMSNTVVTGVVVVVARNAIRTRCRMELRVSEVWLRKDNSRNMVVL
jgi:hypothetical protein